MDKDAIVQELESRVRDAQRWVEMPQTKELLTYLDESKEEFLTLICDRPVVDIETLVSHFEAVGHLRGLRQIAATIQAVPKDVEEALKEAQDEH